MGRIQLMKRWGYAGAMCFAMLAGTVSAKNAFTHRFIRMACNSGSDAAIANGKAILSRAANAGYNGFFFDDSRLPSILTLGSRTTNRMKDICAHARKMGMVVAPMHFGQLTPSEKEINNGEGFPVIGTPFLVAGNTARVKSDHNVQILNGGFEGSANWQLIGGSIAAGRTGKGLFFSDPNAERAAQGIKLKKNRAYRLSFWVKTQDCANTQHVSVDVYDQAKRFYLLRRIYGSFSSWENPWGDRLSKTQNWKQYHLDFNSLESENVVVWVRPNMIAKPNKGKVWFDDVTIQEVGLYETVVRSTTPVIVKSQDGKKTYTEGKDFVVGKEMLTIPAGSAIKNGETLRVNWFQRGDMIGYQPAASFCHRESWSEIWKHAEKIKQVFGTDGVWVKYSEWRTAFWDPSCHREYNGSLPAYMGGVQSKTNDMLRHVYGNCDLPLYLWSDTFDPYHNSKKSNYYQVNGHTYGNWEYMDPKTIIVNWNVNNKTKSHLFFGGKDKAHKITTPVRQIMNAYLGLTLWLDVLDSAEHQGLEDGKVIGISYCTWGENYYDGIEPFANAAKARGRWLSGPVPKDPVSTNCRLTLPDTGNGTIRINGPGNVEVEPAGLALRGHQNRIHFRLAHSGQVRINLLNAAGQTVRSLLSGRKPAGNHSLGIAREKMPAGIYFLRLEVEGLGRETQQITRKYAVM